MPDIGLDAQFMIYLQLIYHHQDKTKKKTQVTKQFVAIWSVAFARFLVKSFGLFVTGTTL